MLKSIKKWLVARKSGTNSRSSPCSRIPLEMEMLENRLVPATLSTVSTTSGTLTPIISIYQTPGIYLSNTGVLSLVDDINQTGASTCVFLSALSGAAMQGMDLASRITYLGNYTYNVKLYNAAICQEYNQQVTFDGVFVYNSDGMVVDPMLQLGVEEFWTLLYQRAYLEMTKTLNVNFTDPN